jgi:hypothetical protein
MDTRFDPNLKAELTLGDDQRVRQIVHTEYFPTEAGTASRRSASRRSRSTSSSTTTATDRGGIFDLRQTISAAWLDVATFRDPVRPIDSSYQRVYKGIGCSWTPSIPFSYSRRKTMSTPQPQHLASSLQWQPWPPGDPGPEIWRIIQEFDRRIQVQVVDAVLDTHIKMENARTAGLQKIRDILAKAQ